MKIFQRFLFPRFLVLSIMGWDDLLVMAIGSMVTAGANKAAQGDSSFSKTEFGQTPSGMGGQQEDPFAWVNQILAQKQARQNQINQ